MIRTRNKPVGREPSLRDDILQLLIDSNSPMTAKDIAECLSVNKTTPFRPLSDLVQMKLITKNENGIDGAEYLVDTDNLIKLQNNPRRSK